MKYRKGSTISTWDSCIIFPLFDWNEQQILFDRLPQFKSLPVNQLIGQLSQRVNLYNQEEIRSFIYKNLQNETELSDHCVVSIIVSLYLITTDKNVVEWSNKITNTKDDNGNVENDHPFPNLRLTQAWQLIKDRTSLEDWKQLCFNVLHNLQIVTQQHPLADYSQEVIPYMEKVELMKVIEILNFETDRTPSIAIQKLVKDYSLIQPTLTYAVLPSLLDNNNTPDDDNNGPSIISFKHSCLPTAQLELDDNGNVCLKAIYDIVTDEDISICYIRDGTVEQRDTAIQNRFGQSCICLRCRFEIESKNYDNCSDNEQCLSTTLSNLELTRIGHYFLTQEKFIEAKQLYQQVLQETLSAPSKSHDINLADIYHALGAVELEMGRFLQAQRIWQDAYHDHPEACKNHDGMMLQVEKMQSYNYFADERICQTINPVLTWDSPTPNCFITHALDNDTCEKMIRWAEESRSWTRTRHYAVPTFDIPIHTVPKLVEWFQNDFMNPIMEQLLANQFKTNNIGRFYVHDAFCVRYESSGTANHLPLHVDESTHSLVVALNDDYEGGGTYFFDGNIVLRPPKGSIISFRGDTLLHGGLAVTRDVRYILAVFMYYDVDYEPPVQTVNTNGTSKTRNVSELSLLLRDAKHQKHDFSFQFDC
jgi:tetratricopeptide (TPR) repeat protein